MANKKNVRTPTKDQIPGEERFLATGKSIIITKRPKKAPAKKKAR